MSTNRFVVSGVETSPKSVATIEHAKVFLNDMGNLLDSGKYTDVTFVIDVEQLPAHKIILAARSPVFAAMFALEDSKESQEGLVDIADVTMTAFKELIRYIYTGRIPDKGQLTLDLMVAADKV